MHEISTSIVSDKSCLNSLNSFFFPVRREQRIELGEAMKEARGMAMDAIKDMKDQKKYAPVIGKMMTQISEISDKYQRLDNKQIRWVQEAAIASFTTHASDTMIDAFNAEAAKSGNTVFKKFSEDRGRKLRPSLTFR